ncbi:MAG: HAD family hydrolase [Pseudomonadales bacterium]|jgi:putative hydrolase of the HAD superfamily|nr:HAD family hydrolase [Pseudomonadales bacterium]
MSTVRLITFDLDDTLWPVGPVIVRAEHRLREYLDVHAPDVNRRFDSAGMAALRDAALARDPELVHDLSTLRRRVLGAALDACGYADAEAIAAGAFAHFLDARHDIEYFEDALDTLAHLARHYTLGALSNGNANVARLGLDRYFAFHLSAESVGRRKPDPAMFEAALQRAGLGPDAAVHIGDHPRDDVRGAAGVGMSTVWVNRSPSAWSDEDVTPTWEIRDLTELVTLFPG